MDQESLQFLRKHVSTKLPDFTLLKMKNFRIVILILQPFIQSVDCGLLPGECRVETPLQQQLTLRPERGSGLGWSSILRVREAGSKQSRGHT